MISSPPARAAARQTEALLLVAVFVAAWFGFLLTALGAAIRYGQPLLAAVLPALVPPILLALLFGGLHIVLRSRQATMEQLLLPVVALLSAIGLVMIWRLRGGSGTYQQLLRGFLPGAAVIGVFILRPRWVEQIRRWTLPVSLL
jgi:hypothetical protein